VSLDEVDVPALAGWMDGQGLGRGPITGVERLTGGSTYILLRFRRDDRDYVLRLPPARKRPTGDASMRREAKVLGALAGSDVPHPRVIAACPTPDVLGAAFYLMKFVDGFNPARALPDPYPSDPHRQWVLGCSIVDGVAAMARVDVEARGLGTGEGWPARQVDRWRERLDACAGMANYPGPVVGWVDEIGRWLDAHRPTTYRPGLLHGDLHIGNMLIRHGTPELAALVDWELAGVGDPLLDLGHLLAVWPGRPAAAWLDTHFPGLPDDAAVVERWASASGRDATDLPWFRVLACYRLAAILEGSRARMLAGLADPPFGDRLPEFIEALLAQAREITDG
jgi:aminoglycoside phosphotransferase (APT) family kinase protein